MQIRKFDDFSHNATAVGFNNESNWIYTGSEDGSVRIYDIRSKSQSPEKTFMDEKKTGVNTVVLEPENNVLIAGDQCGYIKIFDLTAGKLRAKLGQQSDIGITSLSISEDSSHLVAANSAGLCNFWNLTNGDVAPAAQKPFSAHEDYILKVKHSPDSKYS